MTDTGGLEPVATFCGNGDCGCPRLFVDPGAPADRRVVLTDDFGQRIRMSADQFSSLLDEPSRAGSTVSPALSGRAATPGTGGAAQRRASRRSPRLPWVYGRS
nr:hypothetical protein [Streptomyces viridiviolaceus]